MKITRNNDFSRSSKSDFKLSDSQVRKYDKGRTWSNQGYIFFPHNKTRKFIYDVEKEIQLNDALAQANSPELVTEAQMLEDKLRDPYKFYLGNVFGSASTGYHDRAKLVKERNNLINKAQTVAATASDQSAYDEGEYGFVKNSVAHVLPVYAKSRVQNAKNNYRDLVQATAGLPLEDRKKVYKQFEKKVSANFGLNGISAALNLLPVANAVTQISEPMTYDKMQRSIVHETEPKDNEFDNLI